MPLRFATTIHDEERDTQRLIVVLQLAGVSLQLASR
jgi:hypothetical protein